MTDNSDKLDFALIRFLLTLVQTQSMQQTANLLNLSQSGASRKLAKASEIFGTELFIRSGFRMIPSAKMNELHPKLEVLLKQHESLFASTNAFKPASMDRSFNIATMDHGILAILGPAIGPLLREAPNIQINPEFADLFYAYGVLDSGRFIGESSHLVGLGSNQASFYLRA